MDPRTIVTVLDPAAGSDAALVKGVSLARWYGAVLHAVSTERLTGDDLLQRIGCATGAPAPADLRVVPAVLSGRPVRAIADYATRVAADLVVVGSRGRRSSGYWSLGAFASAVGRAVKVPTIAVPEDEPVDASPAFRDILAPIDFSEASLRALAEALVLAQQSGGRLRLLHVLDGFPYESVYSGSRAFRLMDDLRQRVARADREMQALIPRDAWDWTEIEIGSVAGEPAGAILSAAAHRRTDLIVLGLPRRSRLDEMVGGSTAQNVLRRAPCPVLLVPGPPGIRLFDRPASPAFDARHAIRSGWTLDRAM